MIAGIKINLIVAASKNDVIGKDNALPWRQSADLKRFKELTMDHAVIMGRKTYESLPGDLPGRKQVVMTRSDDYEVREGTEKAFSVGSALSIGVELSGKNDVFVIGGSSIFKMFMPIADIVYLTQIDSRVDGDTFFSLPKGHWDLVKEKSFEADNKNQYGYAFQVYTRSIRSENVYSSGHRSDMLGTTQES